MNHMLIISWVLVLVMFMTPTFAPLSYQLLVAAENGDIINKKCIDKERHALLDFKANLQDPSGTISTWIAKEEDCCQWSGVTCNIQTGHVIELHLDGGGLRGEISHSLLNLTYLTYLEFSGNYFNGTIPKFIGSLTQLTNLVLDGNSFYGIIPPELGNLTNLQSLSLRNLTGCSIENINWLSHLSQLEELDIDGLSLAKENNWVNVILSLKKLSSLSLSDCELSQVMHPYTSSSSSVNSSSLIETIDLGNNNLNSSMYHWLFPLTSNSLQNLDLSYNLLDKVPKYLGNLCSLTSLYFLNNSVAISLSDLINNLSGCTSLTLRSLGASGSQFTGSLTDEIQKFSSLSYIYLSHNQLNGSMSEKVWELPNLQTLDLSSNSLRGPLSQNIGMSSVIYIDLSNNSFEGLPSKALMSNHSSVEVIDLSSCKIGPYFPKWIQTRSSLASLSIANNRISDTIPVEFWNMWPSQLTYLNLSSNNITGKVPDLFSNFSPGYSRIDLSSNNFYGHITNVSSTVATLDLSRNNFYGGISFLCQIVDGSLTYLDLSHNSFSGKLPDCLWHFTELKVLNLGNNNLSGRLPASVESLSGLEGLYLYNNNFSGEFPLSLKNCTKLTFLDLGSNMFYGNLPVWIGKNLPGLYVLSLGSNNFFGPIPFQLCELVNLQILDLSMNKLNGTIPSCVNNLTAMVQGVSLNQNLHHYEWSGTSIDGSEYTYGSDYVDHAMLKWQGKIREFSSTLGLVKSIDLSSNNLTGKIPYELANLYQLITLNLSTNCLVGEIPRRIGQMKELQILDISRNNLEGGLPSSMSQMTSLNYLDVSYNNLSGRIPSSTQLQSFEPSRYIGNAGLCGPPVTKSCLGDEPLQILPTTRESEGDGEGKDDLWRWFYIGGGTGFATGFWITCSALLLNRRVRHVFFPFLDSLNDWVYVKVMVFLAKLRTW